MSNPDTEDDEEVEHETVRVIGCDIYFYGDVDRANAKNSKLTYLKNQLNWKGTIQ
jgi:hypothetical protein